MQGIFLLSIVSVNCQPSNLNGVYGSLPSSAFSFAENPAILSRTEKAVIGIYGEKRFLNELGYYSVVADIPVSSGAFGLLANYNGSSALHQSLLALGYGRSLGKKVDLGVQFNYLNLAFQSPYGKAGTFFAKAGFIIALTDKFRSGLTVSNPFGAKLGKNNLEKVPAVFTWGMGYQSSEEFYLGAGVVKEENRDVGMVIDLQYRVVPKFILSGGLNSSTSLWWLGVGCVKDAFRIDISASYHPVLGFTPGTLLQFQLKHK